MDKHLLRPLRPSEVFWRGLYGVNYKESSYIVEVDYFDHKETVRLYRDERLVDKQRSPARFILNDGTVIDAAMALYGMKKAQLIERQGSKQTLRPLPGTAEAQRLHFDREHPYISRAVAALAWIILVVALVTQIPNMINGLANLFQCLPIALRIPLVPTFSFPDWVNIALSFAGIIAGVDRGLRMVHNPLIDD